MRIPKDVNCGTRQKETPCSKKKGKTVLLYNQKTENTKDKATIVPN